MDKACENCGGRNGCPRPEFKDGGLCKEYDKWANMSEEEALTLALTNAQIRLQRYKDALEVIAGEKTYGLTVVCDPEAYAKSTLHPKPPKPSKDGLPF